MKCDSSKICGWITAISQLTVAACVLYVGYLANEHMERMVDSWERTANSIEKMESDVAGIEAGMMSMDKRIWEMNNKLGNMRSRMSPWGMMMP